MGVISLIKRNTLSVLFPTVTIYAIYADWNHTRKWKLQQAGKQL